MRIKLRTGLSGPHYTLNPGDEHDFPDDEAIRFIDAGIAVPVATVAVETAVKEPAETRGTVIPADVAPAVQSVIDNGPHVIVGKPVAKKPTRKAKRS